MRCDDSTGETISTYDPRSAFVLQPVRTWTLHTIETHTVTACGTVHLNLASIWGKPLRRVFGRDTALEGEAASGDMVLRQAKLLERGTSGNLDLGGDDVDACDFLCNCVLDLTVHGISDMLIAAAKKYSHSRVNLDKVAGVGDTH
jgi:hypothetical protein